MTDLVEPRRVSGACHRLRPPPQLADTPLRVSRNSDTARVGSMALFADPLKDVHSCVQGTWMKRTAFLASFSFTRRLSNTRILRDHNVGAVRCDLITASHLAANKRVIEVVSPRREGSECGFKGGKRAHVSLSDGVHAMVLVRDAVRRETKMMPMTAATADTVLPTCVTG